VVKTRMSGGHVPPPDVSVYRCYRCFGSFTKADAADEADGDDVEGSETAAPLRVTDADVAVSPAGGKRAVDRFAVTVRNDGPESVRVTRAELDFSGGETSSAAVDPLVVAPDETATVALARDWLYPDQDAVTVRLIADGVAVGSVRVTDLDPDP